VTQPRIPPRPVEDWDDEVRDALSVLSTRRVVARQQQEESAPRPVSGVIGIFAWHPALTKRWLTFSHHLAESTLSDRVREMLIVRTSLLRRGEYEWVQHVKFARAAGLSEEELEGLTEGPDAKIWEPGDAALIRAVDELCAEHYIGDATWTQLASRFNRQELMDIVFTVCGYDLHATAFNTFGLRLDPGLEGFPADV
jgi:alkylhydroperoxidase family enzyme